MEEHTGKIHFIPRTTIIAPIKPILTNFQALYHPDNAVYLKKYMSYDNDVR